MKHYRSQTEPAACKKHGWASTTLIALGMALGLLSACSPSEDKPATPPPAPYKPAGEKSTYRQKVSCQEAFGNRQLQFDLNDRAVAYIEPGAAEPQIITDQTSLQPNIRRMDRIWSASGGRSIKITLKLNALGEGTADLKAPAGTRKFECKETLPPAGELFIQHICDESTYDFAKMLKPEIASTISANMIGIMGETALTCAVKARNLYFFKELEKNKFSFAAWNINAPNAKGQPPLLVDLENGGKYLETLLEISELKPNSIDFQERSFLHYPSANESQIKSIIKHSQFSDSLFYQLDNTKVSGLGSIMKRKLYSVLDFILKEKPETDLSKPVAPKMQALEFAVSLEDFRLINTIFSKNPTLDLDKSIAPNKRNELVLIAARNCSLELLNLLASQSDIKFTAMNSQNRNALDIVRERANYGSRCASEAAMIELLRKKGTQDFEDVLGALAANNITWFKTALQRKRDVRELTKQLFTALIDKGQDWIRIFNESGAVFDRDTVTDIFGEALASDDKNKIQVFFANRSWIDANKAFTYMQSAYKTHGDTALFIRFVRAWNLPMNASTLAQGLDKNIILSLIEAKNTSLLEEVLNSGLTWSQELIDVSIKDDASAIEYYENQYGALKAAINCEVASESKDTDLKATMPKENILTFALRTNFESELLIQSLGESMNQANFTNLFKGTPVNCKNGEKVKLLNPLALAAKQCMPVSFKKILGVQLRSSTFNTPDQFDGSLRVANAMVRRTPLDALVENNCSSEQRAAMFEGLTAIGSSRMLQFDGVRTGAAIGEISELLSKYDRSIALTEIQSLNLLSEIKYPGLAFMNRAKLNQYRFSTSEEGPAEYAVLGRYSRYLETTSVGNSVAPAMAVQLAPTERYLMTFAGLPSFYEASVTGAVNSNGCMVVNGEGKLHMPDFSPSSLSASKFTVCPNGLEFKFNPTTSEASLPIKNHVKGDFVYDITNLPAE